MNTIEKERLQYEKLESIASNIVTRIDRNPAVFYKNYSKFIETEFKTESLPLADIQDNMIETNSVYKIKKPLRKTKQILAQQHEINRFCEMFENTQSQLVSNSQNKDWLLEAGKKELGGFEELDFLKFDSLVNKIVAQDASSTEAGGKEQNNENNIKILEDETAEFDELSMFPEPLQLLSRSAQDLDMNKFFYRDENYGEILQLMRFHNLWLNVIKTAELSYLNFLKQTMGAFRNNGYEYIQLYKRFRREVSIKEYIVFLKQTTQYLIQFFCNKYPLIDYKLFEKIKIMESYEHILSHGLKLLDRGKENNKDDDVVADKTYCVVCDVFLQPECSYEKHVEDDSKAHFKNIDEKRDISFHEYKLHSICNKLVGDILTNTENFTELKLSYTNKERISELEKLSKLYEEPIYDQNELEMDQKWKLSKESRLSLKGDDSDEENENLDNAGNFNSSQQSVSADVPVPKWLKKLQKLDVEYSCEICGNIKYKGYKTFQKHFFDSKHVFGLKCLGYDGNALPFKGITKISDVKALLKKLDNPALAQKNKKKSPEKNKNQPKNSDNSNTWFIETEDQDGNVILKS